jgi:hypothetical protein
MSGSILHRLFGQYFKRAEQPAPAYEANEDELRSYAVREVSAGFQTRDEICDTVRSSFEDDVTSAVLDRIPVIVDDAIVAHHRAQVTWPTITDCDRLDAAFSALEEQGIVARQNFTCCGTCGVAEIGDEIVDAEAIGRQVDGYTFYHMQDTESAVEGYGVYLNYGALIDDEAAHIGVGHRIAEVARAAGLTVDWNGELSQRIKIELDWKRRRAD